VNITRDGRTIHLIDVENLVGSGRPSQEAIQVAACQYTEVSGLSPEDHVVLGCGTASAFSVFFGWPGEHRRVLGSGRDGADLALLEVLNTEDIASRFTRVFIASGDHLFEPAARRLISQGVDVRIVARPTSVALSLWALGRNIEFPETAVVQEIA
jgi:hypothetical protein